MSKFEHIKQTINLGPVRSDAQRVDLKITNRRITPQLHQFKVSTNPISRFGKVGSQLRRLLIDSRQDPLDTPIRVDEFRCSFLANSGDPGKIVTRITTQGGVLDIQRRSHPGAFKNARLVIQRVIADATLVVHHTNMRISNQLIRVTITGDDDRLIALRRKLSRRRRQNVVSLPASELNMMNTESGQHLTNDHHLLLQFVRR